MRELLQRVLAWCREVGLEQKYGRSFYVARRATRRLCDDLEDAYESYEFSEGSLQELIAELSNETDLEPDMVIQRRWKRLDAEELLKSVISLKEVVGNLIERVPQV